MTHHVLGDIYCANCHRRETFALLDVYPKTYPVEKHGCLVYEASQTEFYGLTQCGRCRAVYLVSFTFENSMVYGVDVQKRRLAFLKGQPFTYKPTGPQQPKVPFLKIHDGHVFIERGINLHPFIRNLRIWPEDARPSCPGYVPKNIKELFIEAQKIFRDAESSRYAAVACRNVVEAVIRDRLGLDKTHENLASLINRVVEEEKIPPVLTEWAHAIRLLGNQGAHPDNAPSEDEVREILEFTRVFLEFVYTYPERIRRLRRK